MQIQMPKLHIGQKRNNFWIKNKENLIEYLQKDILVKQFKS